MKNIAIITGASSGMGKELAIQISKEYKLHRDYRLKR